MRCPGGGSVNQITFHTPKETNDLVVYTSKDTWIMPKNIWKGLAASVWEEDVTVTVRSDDAASWPVSCVVMPLSSAV